MKLVNIKNGRALKVGSKVNYANEVYFIYSIEGLSICLENIYGDFEIEDPLDIKAKWVAETPKDEKLLEIKKGRELCCQHLHYAFKPEFYDCPTVKEIHGKASYRSLTELKAGSTYIVNWGHDSEEEHYLLKFVKTVNNKYFHFDDDGCEYDGKRFLLFIDETDKNYYLVKPLARIHLGVSSKTEISFSLEIEHKLGKNLKKKIVVRRAKCILLD